MAVNMGHNKDKEEIKSSIRDLFEKSNSEKIFFLSQLKCFG